MTNISASEVERIISMVQPRRIVGFRNQRRPKSSRVITNKQKLIIPSTGGAFRNGIDGGRKSPDIVNVTNVTVDTPFLIWAQPSNMLVASNISQLNSTAKIFHAVSSDELGDGGSETVTLNFYFQWQNSSSNPVSLANVTSRVGINGKWNLSAGSSLANPYGNFTMVNANVVLTLLEWWNNPPTQPQFDDAQIAGIFADIIDGGVAILDGPGKNKTETVLNLFDLKYPWSIVVPPKSVMVFQVSVETDIYFLGAGLNTASIRINDSNSFVACPFVQFQVTEDVVSKGPPLP